MFLHLPFIPPTLRFLVNTMEASMRRAILAILTSAAAFGSFATTSASAMPIAPPAAPPSYVDQVAWVCNSWGRCWWRPNYYRPYAYYGHRYDDDDEPPYYRYRRSDGDYDRPHYWGGHGSWHRRGDDDNER